MGCKPIRVVPLRPVVSRATVEVLERLLADARQGALAGLAYVAVYHGNYVADVVGKALDQPILTRGMLHTLDDILKDQTHP